MKNAEKIIRSEISKRELVLKVLEILNGETYADAKDVLDLAAFYLKNNACLDFELARDVIEAVAAEVD